MVENFADQLEGIDDVSVSEKSSFDGDKNNGEVKAGVVGEFIPGSEEDGEMDTVYSRSAITIERLTEGMNPTEKQDYLKFVDGLFPEKDPLSKEESSVTPNRRAALVFLSIVTGVSISALSSLLPLRDASGAVNLPDEVVITEVQKDDSDNLDPEWVESIIEGDPTIAALESIGRPTEHYKDRLVKIAQYKEKLIAYAGEKINLDACAEFCWSIDTSDGFDDPAFVNQEKTVLKNYVFTEQVFEFYKTGKIPEGANFDVIYFEDENGNGANEAAFFYIANSENKVFDVSVVQGAIDWWEERAPGYLGTLVANGYRVLLHSQAGESVNVQKNKYGDGIHYINYSGIESSIFEAMFINSSFEESIGIRCDALGFTNNEEALIKPALALLCFQYALDINKNDQRIASLVNGNQQQIGLYIDIYSEGRSDEEIKDLVESAKKVVTPAGGTWQEINNALGNQTAAAGLGN